MWKICLLVLRVKESTHAGALTFFSLYLPRAEETRRKEKKTYLLYLNDKRIEKHRIIFGHIVSSIDRIRTFLVLVHFCHMSNLL
jgi:hypothetical protein